MSTQRAPGPPEESKPAPSFTGSLLPLSLVVLAVVGWASPPDPFTQLLVLGGGAAVAVGVAYWFADSGHERLDATGADLWLFTYVFLGVLIVVVTLLPDPTLSTANRALIVAADAVVAAVVALRVGNEAVRKRLPGGTGDDPDRGRGPQP